MIPSFFTSTVKKEDFQLQILPSHSRSKKFARRGSLTVLRRQPPPLHIRVVWTGILYYVFGAIEIGELLKTGEKKHRC